MPPTPTKETAKKSSGKMYAWTALHNGGEAERMPVAGGRSERYVVKSRNIVPAGEEVSQSDLGCDDDYWQHLQDTGSVRPYPFPDGVDEYTSPSQAFVASISTGTGEVDTNKLMELGLSNAAEGGYSSDDEAEATAPSGA